jgi:hypothetical protein
MRVSVYDANGELVWERDTTAPTPRGIASRAHVRNGTQAAIIRALGDATAQAAFEASAFQVADIVSDVGRTAA